MSRKECMYKIYKQRDVNLQKPTRCTGAKKYNNWNKKLLESLKCKFWQAEEWIIELEDKTLEIITSEGKQ